MGSVSTFGRVKSHEAVDPESETVDPFDPRLMQFQGAAAKIAQWVLRHPFAIMAFCRRLCPILTFKGWAFVTRYDDVAEALQNDRAVAVPFGPKIQKLNGGPNFVLGMEDGPDYQWLHKATVDVFPVSDNDEIVGPLACELASDLVAEGRGRIDGIKGLLTLVPTRICERYYGVEIPDEQNFARWTIAMSSYMFGDPNDDPNLEKVALAAGGHVRPLIDAAIKKAKHNPYPTPDTITARLVRQQEKEEAEAKAGVERTSAALSQDGDDDERRPPLSDITIRAILIGMITGFVPTNTMASGHMLALLLDHPDWLAQAQEAARSDDDKLLEKCLFEAMRFWPLNPGPFRVAGEDVTLAAGTRRQKTIKKGTKMLVSTQSAMFDPRRVEHPRRFKPHRKQSDYMLMGFGLHWCIGAPLAYSQITQTFKPLLKRHNVRRAPRKEGKMILFGPFPESLTVLYDD